MLVRLQGTSVVVHSPAKLNLLLDVLGRRSDGYHELETVLAAVDLYDTLTFCPESSRIELTCRPLSGSAPGQQVGVVDTRQLSAGPDNLVQRAAELLRSHTGCARGARIVLHKRIPWETGLGGGSSDAAATLIGLNRLWNLHVPPAELHRLAAQLGSDVNFFLDSRPAALCRGRGERISPLRLPQRIHAVIVCPWTGLSTRAVFQRLAEDRPADPTAVEAIRADIRFDERRSTWMWQPLRAVHNALERPARELNAAVTDALTILRDLPAGPAGITGSGSACFVLCRSAGQAQSLAGKLRQHRGSCAAAPGIDPSPGGSSRRGEPGRGRRCRWQHVFAVSGCA
jgi:4-diphosphocytidyl-2-C-methyl-D-erythritol kinase